MFENLDKKYSIITKFFDTLIKNENFAVPNSIILYGSDIIGQYFIAQLLARGANCMGDKTISCNCQNCRWIKANEHPAVMTVSKIDSKPDGDESKTVISVKQINMIKDKLAVSSDYHRFFIFCDAQIKELTKDEKQKFENFNFINQRTPKTEQGQWIPKGLNKICFSDVVANALLKSVEEPPANVTFIFLTENIENIISTIVSRSQAFYVPGSSKIDYDYDFLINPLSNYPNIDRKKAVSISEFLLDYSKKNNMPFTDVIFSIQAFLTEFLKKNAQNPNLKQKVSGDIRKLQTTATMAASSFKEQVIASEIGYILTK